MHFPMFIELEGRPCLIVGGGAVAVRKARALGACGAAVRLVAPDVLPEAVLPGLTVDRRLFHDGDVAGMTLVVAATDDRALNCRVADLCKAQGIPVNVVDDPGNCTFHFPAIVRKGPMVAAVSSEGRCPVAAKLVRDRLAKWLSDDFIAAVERLGRERDELKRAFPDPKVRMRKCEEVLRPWKD